MRYYHHCLALYILQRRCVETDFFFTNENIEQEAKHEDYSF